MTNEEAKEIIECREMIDAMSERANEALDKAVEALEQKPCEDAISREYLVEHIKACWNNGRPMYSPDLSELLSWIDDVPLVQPKPIECEDAISRQAVLDMAITIKTDDYSGNEIMDVVDIDDVKALPPVTPQLKTGRWIPVSERLPKAGEYIGNVPKYYLVQNEYGDMLVARYTHSEYWEQIYQLQPIGDEIVAWMPLPQSYTEGSGEE